jgi:hypothetical protein
MYVSTCSLGESHHRLVLLERSSKRIVQTGCKT